MNPAQPDPKPTRVVILDDHPAVRAGLQRLLERSPGLQPIAAFDSSPQLLALLARQPVDVAVIDYDLQRGDGLSLCLKLKHHDSPPAVAIYSAYAGPALDLVATVAQADAVIHKAEPIDTLVHAIHRIANGQRLLPPPTHEQLHTAAQRLDPTDLPLLSLLIHATPTIEIARTLSLNQPEIARRARRIIGLLQADGLKPISPDPSCESRPL